MSNVTKICNAENDLFWKRSIISHICHKVQKIFPIITKIYDIWFAFSFYSELKLCLLHLFPSLYSQKSYLKFIFWFRMSNVGIINKMIFILWYSFSRFCEWILSKGAFVANEHLFIKWCGNKANKTFPSLCCTRFCLSHGMVVFDVNCFWVPEEKSTKSRNIKM